MSEVLDSHPLAEYSYLNFQTSRKTSETRKESKLQRKKVQSALISIIRCSIRSFEFSPDFSHTHQANLIEIILNPWLTRIAGA